MRTNKWLIAVSVVLVVGCGTPDDQTDGGTSDGAVRVVDAGHSLQDAGTISHDAGLTAVDAGTTVPFDAGTSEPFDAGTTEPFDAGTTQPFDAGTTEPFDAGTTGPFDAGTSTPVDAGTAGPFDAGTKPTFDAGTPVADAGVVDAGTLGITYNNCTDDKFVVSTTVSSDVTFGNSVGNAYSPACLQIGVGSRVIFKGAFSFHPLTPGTVQDGAAGTQPSPIVFVNSGSIDSKVFTFDAVGDYPYYCMVHGSGGMAGVIRVR